MQGKSKQKNRLFLVPDRQEKLKTMVRTTIQRFPPGSLVELDISEFVDPEATDCPLWVWDDLQAINYILHKENIGDITACPTMTPAHNGNRSHVTLQIACGSGQYIEVIDSAAHKSSFF